MTAMPQLVALFNGFGGAASALVAAGELVRMDTPDDRRPVRHWSIGIDRFGDVFR